ncbi:MAG: transposase [Mogibacterium sp.]|nr:transposase [Mogibacterium sp.]MBQ6501157.1 transposase [Mogibacterium sp.]
MARTARKLSESGIYHVMMRGINRQQIFFEESDYAYFIRLLGKYKSVSGYELFAYCLMGNHVHLLIRVRKEPLSVIMKRIGGAFAYWYNGKYERTGHLFQDRFKSEVIDSERYFIAALRYILRNPVKAGMCKRPEDYKYSSGREYLCDWDGITDTDFVFSLIEAAALEEFIAVSNDDQFLEIEEKAPVRLTDNKARAMILDEFGTFSPTVGKPGERHDLYFSIRKLIRNGISIRQLSRLTGIPKKLIENALK